MQVKKFEAPTIQEALDRVKRELGPEAIILQTKKTRKGLGLLSKSAVEVTAAVSERSIQKKQYVENRVPESNRDLLKKLPAQKQADLLEKYVDNRLHQAASTEEKVELGARAKKITATRYADISDEHGRDVDAKSALVSPSKPQKAPAPTPPPAASRPSMKGDTQEALQEEVRSLRQVVQELKNSQENSRLTPVAGANRVWDSGSLDHPVLQECFEKLVLNGVDRRYAYGLLKKVAFEIGPEKFKKPDLLFDALASELMDSIEISQFPKMQAAQSQTGTPLIMALVGPTGSGKTSTIAKIAGQCRSKRQLKAGLIQLSLAGENNEGLERFESQDRFGFGQLGTYAKALNFPFRVVSSSEDLMAAISDFKSMDLVLIDTPGRSYFDQKALSEIQKTLSTIQNLRVSLVLGSGTRDSEMFDCCNRYSIFKPNHLIFSKLDETRIYGGLYNVFQKTKIPLLFFTTGQKIPEDLEEATAERVASLVLRI